MWVQFGGKGLNKIVFAALNFFVKTEMLRNINLCNVRLSQLHSLHLVWNNTCKTELCWIVTKSAVGIVGLKMIAI